MYNLNNKKTIKSNLRVIYYAYIDEAKKIFSRLKEKKKILGDGAATLINVHVTCFNIVRMQ